jgi:hypothetical protein
VKVWIKNFNVELEVKTSGIELDVSGNDGKHLGDLYVTKAKLIWCKGRIPRNNGKEIRWEEFMAIIDSR